LKVLIYTFNNIELDTNNYRLLVDGVMQPVEPQVFNLMVYLIQNKDKVLSRDEILDHIWKGKIVSDSSISNHIKTARKVLGDDGVKQQIIKTIHSRGYQFIADCQIRGESLSNESADSTNHNNKYVLPVLVLILLIIGVLVIKSFQTAKNDKGVLDNSIAVLAFEDLSPNADQNYFAEGLSEELLNIFTQIPDLRVSSRTSSFSYRDKDMRIEEIGKELNVKYIIEGSIRKFDKKLRVTAQLINVSDGSHKWSETYDYELQDVFKIQDEIANAVSEQLKISLLTNNNQTVSINPEAHSFYLQALYYLGLKTPDDLNEALKMIEQSIQIDSNNANAWALKSRIYYQLNQFSFHKRDNEIIKKTIKSVNKSKELNHKSAMVNAQMALIDLWKYDFESARYNIELAMSVSDKTTSIIEMLAYYYQLTGQIEKSIEMLDQAMDKNPVVEDLHYQQAMNYFYLDQLKEAFSSMNRYWYFYSKSHTTHGLISQIHVANGNNEKAQEYAKEEPNEFYKLLSEGFVSYAAGDQQQADAILNILITDYSKSASSIASLYAFRKETENAFKWLDIAFKNKDTELLSLINAHQFRNIWDDPRWQIYLNKINLPKNHWLRKQI